MTGPTSPATSPASVGRRGYWPKRDPDAMLAYVQTRALVGGTTAIQGWPAFNRPPQMVLRDIDDEEAGTTNRNLVYTSVITETPLQLAHTAQLMSRGAGFIYHCSEGQPGSVVAREFTDVANAGCLEKKLVAIHCNAVADSDWQRWQASDAGAVVWSPFSNYWLYGSTTNIPAAQKAEEYRFVSDPIGVHREPSTCWERSRSPSS